MQLHMKPFSSTLGDARCLHRTCPFSAWTAEPAPSPKHTSHLCCAVLRRRTVAIRSRAEDAGEASSDSVIPDTMPLSASDTDWRDFRARLVASTSGRTDSSGSDVWVHPVPRAEAGCILIAHPLMFTATQQYFAQAVVFLFQHGSDDRRDQGSAGLILNKPTQFTLGEIAGAEVLCPEFASNTLFLGGDVGEDSFHSLHNQPGLKNSMQIVRGVSMGGWEAAKAEVARGSMSSRDVKFFSRYCGWAPGQLDRECGAGVWFTAAASASFLLQQEGSASGPELWHQALDLQGGDLAALSKAMKGEYDASIMEWRAEQASDQKSSGEQPHSED